MRLSAFLTTTDRHSDHISEDPPIDLTLSREQDPEMEAFGPVLLSQRANSNNRLLEREGRSRQEVNVETFPQFASRTKTSCRRKNDVRGSKHHKSSLAVSPVHQSATAT